MHTTWRLRLSNPLLDTVPHTPLLQYSTLPSMGVEPLTKRRAPPGEQAVDQNTHINNNVRMNSSSQQSRHVHKLHIAMQAFCLEIPACHNTTTSSYKWKLYGWGTQHHWQQLVELKNRWDHAWPNRDGDTGSAPSWEYLTQLREPTQPPKMVLKCLGLNLRWLACNAIKVCCCFL